MITGGASMDQKVHRTTGRRDSTVRRWNRYDSERIALGLVRYTGCCWACVKYLVALPWFRAGMTNRFARGALALQDELGYRSSVIHAREVWELFPGIEDAEVRLGRLFPDEGSSVSYREMVVLCSIIRHERARIVFEIGTSLGVTAFNIGLNLAEGGIAYTLDLPSIAVNEGWVRMGYNVSISDRKMIFANRQPRRFLSSTVEARVSQLYGDSATFDYSPYKGRCDMVFVDGAHSIEYVESDTKAAFQLVRQGGLVVWHDYNDGFFWPDVHRYLNRFARDHVIHRIRGTMFAVARV
jgi:predicted O-methyltransferase YrrM